jgi:hypothetical protein
MSSHSFQDGRHGSRIALRSLFRQFALLAFLNHFLLKLLDALRDGVKEPRFGAAVFDELALTGWRLGGGSQALVGALVKQVDSVVNVHRLFSSAAILSPIQAMQLTAMPRNGGCFNSVAHG